MTYTDEDFELDIEALIQNSENRAVALTSGANEGTILLMEQTRDGVADRIIADRNRWKDKAKAYADEVDRLAERIEGMLAEWGAEQ